ncbi:MAG: response regulator transcription factor [Gammaproteobacteria bacterium]|nr:response regulator transcription factor [Gammaproteobacteria bacterium]
MRILLIEDDRDLAEGLRRALEQSGYTVDWIADGERANAVLKTDDFDLVVLDLGLPRLDGLSVLRQLRAREKHIPVLITTASDSVEARVKGLDLGADDYLGKPFELTELEARVRALLRRSQGRSTGELRAGNLLLDTNARRASIAAVPLDLPRRELCLLEILMTRMGKVVSKEQIASQLFSFDDEVSPNTIEIYVSRLRKKLAPAGPGIDTVRGLGYVLKP